MHCHLTNVQGISPHKSPPSGAGKAACGNCTLLETNPPAQGVHCVAAELHAGQQAITNKLYHCGVRDGLYCLPASPFPSRLS